MRSRTIKLLHAVAGRPMVAWVLDAAKALGPTRTITVVGYQAEQVKDALADSGSAFVLQKEQRGTGHAVVFWFDLHLDAETTLSTGRGSPHNHWGQAIQFLDRDLAVAAGQPVPLIAGHSDTQFRFRAG